MRWNEDRRRSLLVLLIALAWQPARSDSVADLAGKIRYRERQVAGLHGAVLKLVFFDEKDFRLRVVVNPDCKTAKGLDALGEELGAVAVCNGGYFDVPKLLPEGLEITDGKRTGTFVMNKE
jgi:hypothetical protein